MNQVHLAQRLNLFNHLSKLEECVFLLDSNGYDDGYGSFSWLILAGKKRSVNDKMNDGNPWDALRNFLKEPTNAPFIPGFLSYDLKNYIENLHSNNLDQTEFDLLSFVEPTLIYGFDRMDNLISYGDIGFVNSCIHEEIKSVKLPEINLKCYTSEEAYEQHFNTLKSHILRGDIYEVNYCIHFGSLVKELNPIELYSRLTRISPSPFACLMKNGNQWLIGSSPERFIHKKGKQLISQPIKGTIRKSESPIHDQIAIEQLKNDPKERAENIMIVDLVRNDLSHYALKGSVIVEELCEIYPFATVHHMISTIKAELTEQKFGLDAMIKAFPMGSMTGAPKIRAMQLAEEEENFRRGIYAGAIGYFTSEGDYDFAVIIRSFTWNAQSGYLSFSTGGAITQRSNAKNEYSECLLKAEALMKACNDESAN